MREKYALFALAAKVTIHPLGLHMVFKGIPEPAQVTRDARRVRPGLVQTLEQEFGCFEPGGYVVALRIEAAVFSKKIDGFFQFQVVECLDAQVDQNHVLPNRESGPAGRPGRTPPLSSAEAGAELESRPPGRRCGEAARRRAGEREALNPANERSSYHERPPPA